MVPLRRLALGIICISAQATCLFLQIDKLHVHSFVPDEIYVSTSVDHLEAINFNLTIKVPFAGKLLMHIFLRKLSDTPGGSDFSDLMRLKNMDLCKVLDSLRNISTDHGQGESLLPSTFFISCPLVPGFYYVANSAIDVKFVPFRVPDGRYLAMLELVQVYEEVIKLVTCRIKFSMTTPPGYVVKSDLNNSVEEPQQVEPPKEEPPKEEPRKEEPPKEEPPKEEPPKEEPPQEEPPKDDPPMEEPPKEVPPKEEPPKEKPPKEEPPKEEPPKEEPPKEEPPKEEPRKEEPPKEELPQEEPPMEEPPMEEPPMEESEDVSDSMDDNE
ncbi:repetitive proline-rich cell wall protein 2 [Drosophila persimilis]|nr:repetitive proline-rich cell wall protein 2 [Drosophila persimilis]